MDEKFDVIAITVYHDDFDNAVAGVTDWVLLANGVSEEEAAEVTRWVDEKYRA